MKEITFTLKALSSDRFCHLKLKPLYRRKYAFNIIEDALV